MMQQSNDNGIIKLECINIVYESYNHSMHPSYSHSRMTTFYCAEMIYSHIVFSDDLYNSGALEKNA